jgi:hypothetical protein
MYEVVLKHQFACVLGSGKWAFFLPNLRTKSCPVGPDSSRSPQKLETVTIFLERLHGALRKIQLPGSTSLRFLF